MTYELALRLGDKQLARDSFAIIDRLMPPNAQMARRSEISPQSMTTPWQLVGHLKEVRTVADWQSVLRCARDNFREQPLLPEIGPAFRRGAARLFPQDLENHRNSKKPCPRI